MNAFRYFIMPVVFASGLISNVYASTPDYIKSFGINAPESGLVSFFKAIYYIVMFGLILAAAYYATKFLAKKGMAQGKTKTMRVIESMPLGADKSLHLVKVGTQVFLIGSASKNMFLISEVEAEKLQESQEFETMTLEELEAESYETGLHEKGFEDYLNSVKQNMRKLKSMVRGSNDNEK